MTQIDAGTTLLTRPAGVSGPAGSAIARVADASDGGILGAFEGVLRDAATSLRASEAASVAGLAGQLPVDQVVQAVMTAEQQLQTAVALRDKIVAAYLEISRMPI